LYTGAYAFLRDIKGVNRKSIKNSFLSYLFFFFEDTIKHGVELMKEGLSIKDVGRYVDDMENFVGVTQR
jgi:hypothetical protein